MIEARNLTRTHGSRTAVDDLSSTVQPGIVTGFLAPNGSGTSTTMRLILGLDTPTSGTVTVNGRPCTDDLLSPTGGALVLLAWALIPLLAAAAALRRRDT